MLTCRRCGTGSRIPPHASSRSSGQEASGRPVWRWSSHARSRTEGATRVVFVPLAAIRDPAFVASAIAEALGLADVTALDLPRRARVACADHPTLLVLDNFEQVLDAAPLVADLLTSVASLRLLVTSRAPLRVRGEREYAVGPLALEAGSEAMSPADLARAPAVRLFVERVRDVQPDFRLTSANGPTVTAICRRLDALPLALELAAPWIKVLTAEDLLRRLEHDVLLSTVGPRDLPERQQTMNATVAWSYQLLDPDEQRAFRRFGALPGLFPIDAAAAVLAGREGASAGSDEALRAAAGLIDKSLLLRAETSWWRRVRCTRCSRPCGRTRPSSSPRRASATTPWRGWCAIARVKPPSPRRGWSDLRRSNGWIACVTISRATAAR